MSKIETMISANELRIGNIAVYHGETDMYCVLDAQDIYNIATNYMHNAEIHSPIPLTEDWHNKFGVIKDGFNQFEYKYAVGKSIIFTGDYVYLLNTNSINGERSLSDHICTLWNKDIERRDMYVHEWQNLYFALTGEELTINL